MKSLEEIVNDSGYPLQIRLEEWIKDTYREHRWKVLASEHRWVNGETKDEGFIDLVLESKAADKKLVVECKRIIGNWVFLLPKVQFAEKSTAKALFMHYNQTNQTFFPNWEKSLISLVVMHK